MTLFGLSSPFIFIILIIILFFLGTKRIEKGLELFLKLLRFLLSDKNNNLNDISTINKTNQEESNLSPAVNKLKDEKEEEEPQVVNNLEDEKKEEEPPVVNKLKEENYNLKKKTKVKPKVQKLKKERKVKEAPKE